MVTWWFPSNCYSDSVTDSLMMYNLCWVPSSKNDQAHYMNDLTLPSHTNEPLCCRQLKIKESCFQSQPWNLQNNFCLIFYFFLKIISGLLSVDRKSWLEHLVNGTSFEMRDLTPGSNYHISIQSVLGSDVSRAVIKELSTRKRHTCTNRTHL